MITVQEKDRTSVEVSKEERELLFFAFGDYLRQRVASGLLKKCACRCAAQQPQHTA